MGNKKSNLKKEYRMNHTVMLPIGGYSDLKTSYVLLLSLTYKNSAIKIDNVHCSQKKKKISTRLLTGLATFSTE